MIPRRRPSRDGYGNGVSCRVEACRKRLRSVRTSHAAQVRDDYGVEPASVVSGGGAVAAPVKLSFVQADMEGQEEAGLT